MTPVRKALAGVAALAVILAGCTSGSSSSQTKDQATTQEYYNKLRDKVPYPLEQMQDSIERRNLREKLLRFTKPDKLGYVYLMSQTGEVVTFFTIKGKVSSTQSQMTTSDVVGDYCDNSHCDHVSTKGPSDDGSYGENESGIFFFTTEDVYVTWSGSYIYMDAPLKVDSVTHKIQGVTEGAKPSSVGEEADKRSGK